MGVCECPPYGDDPPRIGADLGHVGETHVLGLSSQLAAQHVDLRSAHHDQDRIAGLDCPADER
jgi:hypothetical protein